MPLTTADAAPGAEAHHDAPEMPRPEGGEAYHDTEIVTFLDELITHDHNVSMPRLIAKTKAKIAEIRETLAEKPPVLREEEISHVLQEVHNLHGQCFYLEGALAALTRQ